MNTKKINIGRIVDRTKGYSGAELKATCVEAGMIAIRDERSSVSNQDMMDAITRLDKKRAQGTSVRSPKHCIREIRQRTFKDPRPCHWAWFLNWLNAFLTSLKGETSKRLT